MYNITNPMTYGEAADFVNNCDEWDIMIYFERSKEFKIPVDNYQLFKILVSYPPEDQFPMVLSEDDDNDVKLGYS